MYHLDDVTTLASIMMFAVLSLMGFLNRPRDVASIAFAVFAGVVAIDTSVTFAMNQVTTLASFRVFLHVAFTVGILVPASALFHVLACTGFISRMNDTILGLKVRTFVIAVATLHVVVGALFHVVFLVDIIEQPDGHFVPTLTPMTVVFVVVVVVVVAVNIMALMVKALREVSPGPRRRYLRSNLIGMLLIMVPGPVIGILFALQGVQAQLLIQGFVLVGSVIFYIAINRYQLDRIQELNVGLEAKVDQRTRHLRQAQLRLVQGERAAALGRLVAGVTHEVSTPTGAIVSSADTIERALGKIRAAVTKQEGTFPKLTRAVDVVESSNTVVLNSGRRIAHLVDNLRNFVHLDGAERVEVDLHSCLECTVDLLQHEFPPGVQIVRRFGEIPAVRGNQAELNQVFMHLLRNAGQAISEQGTITISTELRGDVVRVAIADDGCGIAADRLDGLFDLQFSTGEKRVKLGVGLATSRQIVEHHGGEISASSGPAQGTVLAVDLPP